MFLIENLIPEERAKIDARTSRTSLGLRLETLCATVPEKDRIIGRVKEYMRFITNSLLKPFFAITSLAVSRKSDSRLLSLLIPESLPIRGSERDTILAMLKERKSIWNPDKDSTMLDMTGPATSAKDNAVEKRETPL